MNSEKDSYYKSSIKLTRILGQTDPERQNNETSIRLDQPGSPSGRVRPNKQSNSPARGVGDIPLVLPTLAMVYKCFKYIIVLLESF